MLTLPKSKYKISKNYSNNFTKNFSLISKSFNKYISPKKSKKYKNINKIPSELRNLFISKPKEFFINKKNLKLRRKRRHRERRFRASIKKNMPYVQRRTKWIKRRNKKRKYKFENHYLNITGKVKNFFLSVYHKYPQKQKFQYNKKYYKYKILINLLTSKSIGALGYKGRHKTSPLAKEILGKTIGNNLQKNNLPLIDIILKNKVGRIYKPIIKGIAKSRVLVRKITIKSMHPHGFIRPRKKRRK